MVKTQQIADILLPFFDVSELLVLKSKMQSAFEPILRPGDRFSFFFPDSSFDKDVSLSLFLSSIQL